MTRHFPASFLVALSLIASANPSRGQTAPTSKIYVGTGGATVITAYTMDGQPTSPAFALNSLIPSSAAFGPDGKIYVTHNEGNVPFQVFDQDGHPAATHIPKFAGSSFGVAVGPGGNVYFSWAKGVLYFTPSGKQTILNIPPGSGPAHIAVDASGKIYYAAQTEGYVKVYDSAGKEIGPTITSGLQTPRAIAVAPNGTIYVSNYLNVTSYSADGKQTKVVLTHIGPEGGPDTPTALTVDSAGKIYVGYYGAGGVAIFNPDGSLVRFFPTPRMVTAIAVR